MKAVLVTGASTGIGYAISIELAKRGYHVFACARKVTDLEKLKKAHPNIQGFELDVTNATQIESAAKQISELKFESFSIINNAGIVVAGPLEAIKIKDIKYQFEVNCFGLLQVTQVFLPLIRKLKGRVVNLSSIAGLQATPFMGPYCASKYAVEAFSDSLRREVSAFGVKVVLIEPGSIATPIWDKSIGNADVTIKALDQERYAPYAQIFTRFMKLVEKIATHGRDVENVTDAVISALENPEPPPRMMVVSFSEWIQVRLTQILPATWIDKAFQSKIKGDLK